jgi:hypothetical protein
MANDMINFHISREDAKKRPDPEKINILIDLGFDSNERMAKVEKTLHGNGEPGLCQTVNNHADRIAFLSKIVWIILTVVGAAAVGVIITGIIPGAK